MGNELTERNRQVVNNVPFQYVLIQCSDACPQNTAIKKTVFTRNSRIINEPSIFSEKFSAFNTCTYIFAAVFRGASF